MSFLALASRLWSHLYQMTTSDLWAKSAKQPDTGPSDLLVTIPGSNPEYSLQLPRLEVRACMMFAS